MRATMVWRLKLLFVQIIVKIAAIHAWWDLKAGVAKTISLTKEAAPNGAKLIGFPESFIPGYPMAILFKENNLSVQSAEFKEILDATKEAAFNREQPTGHERTVWGDGAGSSFCLFSHSSVHILSDDLVQSAVKGPGGAMITAFNCCWPYCDSIEDGATAQFSSDAQILQSEFVALEGQMLVISSTQILSSKNTELCGVKGSCFEISHGGGFAAIYALNGAQITVPTKPDEEIILYADIDLDAIKLAKLVGDPVGHYRPNLLVSYDGKQDYTFLSHISQ
ncbi:carbon-nitrogen hydrolase [Mycena maculata]|uniref:Carbon-nitrogen hydrolase n=1 Tax=Mycena maculata TaxID=230809 RepID=A0AAD7JF20_9AGAR|nr:carbon-nitrogen hydrolase [Mycena maculata]